MPRRRSREIEEARTPPSAPEWAGRNRPLDARLRAGGDIVHAGTRPTRPSSSRPMLCRA